MLGLSLKTCPRCKMRFENAARTCVFDGTPLDALKDPRLGATVAGRYVIDEVIGEGGMATVYGATHKLTGKPVALKVMHSALSSDPVVRERFRREAKNAQRLTHPNIIEIYDQGETEDGTPFIAMERLHGAPLSATIGSRTMTLRRALHIMVQLARGVARAHDLDVVHRDIKPDNIFLCPREDGAELVKILDFGIAKSLHDTKITAQGELFGTPQYMAPERIKNQETGPAADLYALGVVFYELLTGELPFDAQDIATFFVKHLRDPAPAPSSRNREVPPELDALVGALLAKDPAQRPVDAHRIQTTVLEILHQLSLDAPPTPETLSESSAQRMTLEPSTGGDTWQRRAALFDEMIALAYGDRARAPRDLMEVLTNVHKLVARHAQTRLEQAAARREAERTAAENREKRLRLGFAVDVLGQDSSRAKEDARQAQAALAEAQRADEGFPAKLRALGREVLVWEGRTALREPSRELAEIYEGLASTTRAWLEARASVTARATELAAREARVADIDFQLRELRGALATVDQEADDELAGAEAHAHALEELATSLESQLVAETQLFCMPLRKRRELGPLFRRLETEAAHP